MFLRFTGTFILFHFVTDCARDTNVYFPEKGMSVAEVCQPNGNYRHSQTSGDVTYCVDSDGYPYESEDDWPEECVRNQIDNGNNNN